jgi:hypothetical protein
MNIRAMIRCPSAFLPIMMSLSALATVVVCVMMFGTTGQADEGTAAHLWQLLMAAQIPVIAFFALRWLPQHPASALAILSLQVIAATAALLPVYLLHW